MAEVGVTPTLEWLCDRPHLSLAVLDDVSVPRCISMLEQFSQTQRPFAVDFSAFDSFPTVQGVVYLRPAPDESLFAVHRAMHQQLVNIGGQVDRYYVLGHWVPHATVGFELSSSEVELALSWLRQNFKVTGGTFSSIGLIEFLPIRQLANFRLGASSAV